MANPHKGELAFEAEGKSYRLRFSANAICELEAQLDCACSDIIDQINDAIGNNKSPRYSLARAMLWAGLTDRQPGITLHQAGELMGALGGLAPTMQLITKGLTLAFPDAPNGAETKDARPTNGDGTGRDSMPAG